MINLIFHKMFLFNLFTFCTLLCLINSQEPVQIHKPIEDRFNDLYLQCRQNNGHKLCLGITNTGRNLIFAEEFDCVKKRNCVLLFQYETDPDSMKGEHCLYFSKKYRDLINKEMISNDALSSSTSELVANIGVRFGYKPVVPTLESNCFLSQSNDFNQIFYTNKKELDRIRKSPAFEDTFIRFDEMPENFSQDNIYCCFKQPLKLRLNNLPNEFSDINVIDLDRRLYISLYYRMGGHNNSLRSNDPLNLIDYIKEKPLPPTRPSTRPPTTTIPSTSTTTITTTTTTSTSTSTTEFPTESSTNPSDKSSPQTLTDNTSTVDPIKPGSSPILPEPSNGNVLLIFGLSIVLLAFFLLIALSLYNLMVNK